MVEDNSIVDEVDCFSVVVDNNDLFSLFIELTAFDKVLVMGINVL